MTLNEKIIKTSSFYTIDITFDFIRYYMKKLYIFYVDPFVGTGHAIIRP